MPNHAPWPPPGGRHHAGLIGPTRRYALIVLVLAVTSSLPILAAIGPGERVVGDALAGAEEPGGTTPFIPPPSEGPVVVIPIRPDLGGPPPPVTTLPAPGRPAPPVRQQVKRQPAKAKPEKSSHRRIQVRVRAPQPERATVAPRRKKPHHVVRERKLWRHAPSTLVHPCRKRHWHPHRARRAWRTLPGTIGG